MRSLNLDQLRTLVAIADLGTFSAAARALNLAQPTVSLHVGELESRLGLPLLVRGGKAVTPTGAGHRLVERARHLLAEADALLHDLRQRAAGESGRIAVGASTGLVVQVFPAVLEAMARLHAGIAVDLRVLGTRDVLDGVRKGTLDVGVVGLPQADAAGLVLTPWHTAPMAAFVPARWAGADMLPARATPAWLAARPLLANEPSSHMHRLVMAWFAKAGLEPTPRIELNFDEALKSLVAAGYGAAVLPLDAPDAPAPPGIRVLPLRPAMVRRNAIVHRPTAQLDAATRHLLAVMAGFGRR